MRLSSSDAMAKRDPRMIPLGYGKFVRADRIYALVPIEGSERQDGRRTYVHVDGLTEPVVASRSERAILADVETALAEAAGCRAAAACRGDGAGDAAALESYNSSTAFRTFCTDSLASPNRSDVFSA